MMTSALLRQLIREQIEGLLLEGDLQIRTINDIDVESVAREAISSGNLPDPRFIGESTAFAEAFNDGEKFQRWSRRYETLRGEEKVMRGTSQVRYSNEDWIIIPGLVGKGGDFGGVLKARIPDNDQKTALNAIVITAKPGAPGLYDEELVKAAIAAKYTYKSATEFTMPYILVGTTKVARAFVYKLASGTKSEKEAVEKANSWIRFEKDQQEVEQKRAEKEVRAASRGAARASSSAPPPAPSKPEDLRAKLDRMRAEKQAKK